MNFDRRITPIRPDLADERLRGTVEATRFSAGTLRRVAAPSTPLRSHPAADAPIDTEALMGEAVRVYDENEGWAWGQLVEDGYVGYLSSAALGSGEPAPTHAVWVLRTFVYPGPNMKLPPLGHLSLGARVSALRHEGEYTSLSTGGFVFTGLLARRRAR